MGMNEKKLAPEHVGVGIDTARYGHHVAFLGEDRQEAARSFGFEETAAGYADLAAALEGIEQHRAPVHFDIRIDAAGQYAANLEQFLRGLDCDKTISVGEPKRNRDYRNAIHPKRKADVVDSRSNARFAVIERPEASVDVPAPMRRLREVASTLNSQRKHTTRTINQLHNQLARVFPELAMMVSTLAANWVLSLLQKYPSARRIGAARLNSLLAIAHINHTRAHQLQQAARNSTASLSGPLIETMIEQSVKAVRASQQAERKLEELLEVAFDDLGDGPHRQLLTIPGIGKRTAAALVAKIAAIERFETPAKLVSYFGVFPQENSSGVDKHGLPLPTRMRMSAKGNDLVRSLLWMACQSAIRHNAAIRPLYARHRAAGKRGDVALGHCMRKMLHLVFALWTTDKPFDPNHHPWESHNGVDSDSATTAITSKAGTTPRENAGGRKEALPPKKAVTPATNTVATRSLSESDHPLNSPFTSPVHSKRFRAGLRVDFAHVRSQIEMKAVLQKLGMMDRMRGVGAQRHAWCPIHCPEDTTSRTLSVHLGKSVFRCMDPDCGVQGNVLDLWARVHRLELREASIDLAETFHLDLAPTPNRRKR